MTTQERTAWLESLQPGMAVTLHTPFGQRPATVSSIGTKWIVLDWTTTDGAAVISSVDRVTGGLQAMRVYIGPEEPDHE